MIGIFYELHRSAKKHFSAAWNIFSKLYVLKDVESKNDFHFPPSHTVFLQTNWGL